MASVYKSILDAVQSEIQDLDLTGIADDDVVIAKLPIKRPEIVPNLPACLIAPFGSTRIDPNAGTNQKDEIQYPVLVATLASSNQSQDSNLERHLEWQETLRKKFIHQRLTGASEVEYCFVDPRDTFDASAFHRNYDAGGMILRFVTRETRG